MIPSPDFRSRGTMTQAMRDYIAQHPGLTKEALWSEIAELPEVQGRFRNPNANFTQALKQMLRDEEIRLAEDGIYPTGRLRVTPRS